MNNNNGCNRREFLSRGSVGLAAAGMFGLNGTSVFRRKPGQERKPAIYRTLGKTGIELPVVNMGVMNADNPDVLKRAYDSGVRLFDTASIYQQGRNEEMIGKVVKDFKLRDDVIIMTKTNAREGGGLQMRGGGEPEGRENVMAQFVKNFEGCLKRLQTDYVDILLCHGVGRVSQVNDPGIRDAFRKIKNEKKARFVGMATHSNQTEIVNAVTESGFYDVVLVSFNFTMWEDEELIAALKKAADKGIGVIAMKTQAGSRGRGGRGEPVNQTAALKWALRHEFVTTAIPGFTNYDHLEEDFSVAYDLEYTDEEKEFLSGRDVRLGFGFCRQCGDCRATCPKNVDIPTLMRTHMYAAQYTNFSHARYTLGEIEPHNGIRACTDCRICTARCSHSVDIAANIADLKMLYV